MTRILTIHSMKRSVIAYEKKATIPRRLLPRPVQDSLSPYINQAYEQYDHKQHHLAIEYVLERAVSGVMQHIGKNDCPGNQENCFYVEQQEYHRYQVEFD